MDNFKLERGQGLDAHLLLEKVVEHAYDPRSRILKVRQRQGQSERVSVYHDVVERPIEGGVRPSFKTLEVTVDRPTTLVPCLK